MGIRHHPGTPSKVMKFQITESCLIRGIHAQAGEIVEVTDAQAAALYQAGRGFPATVEAIEEIKPIKPIKYKK